MEIFAAISSFLYRIRYKLIFGVAFAVCLTIYFTRYLPVTYSVTTTIFTGITTKSSLDDMSGRMDRNTANNAHDNIINLVKSKSTLELVSINLIAQHLMYGDPNKDNKYIKAANYKYLLKIMSPDLLKLVDKTSMENTVKNLLDYKTDDRDNCLYGAFNWNSRYYSYSALSKIKIIRKGASDMIEMSYECDDPGIAANTLDILNKKLTAKYESLLLSTSIDVTKHFEEQVKLAKEKLDMSEDDLVQFNVDNNIINYTEQTKHLAALNNSYEERYEMILLEHNSSLALVSELESQMNTKTKLVRENEKFLDALADVSSINGKIAEIEIFGANEETKAQLDVYRQHLLEAEDLVKVISDSIDSYRFSKEGVAISEMVSGWLNALIKYEKSKAELEVMVHRKESIQKQYEVFSPVGPNIGRKDRNVRVEEEAYLSLLYQLGLARLKQKNILLDAGTLQIVTPPDFPLSTIPRNRERYVIAAFFAALIFISCFFLIIELIDKTIRDGARASRITSGRVLGAFPGNYAKYRQYSQEVKRMAIAYLANIINRYANTEKTTIINILSIEPGEGKSYIAQQLKDYWTERDFSVTYISYHNEFDEDMKSFRKASTIYQLMNSEQKSDNDIIIVEYAPLMKSSIPQHLLEEASVNLLILDAERVWTPSDDPIFKNLNEMVNHNLFIYLNKADREAVQHYLGQLPPYTFIRNLSYRLFNFGITAKK